MKSFLPQRGVLQKAAALLLCGSVAALAEVPPKQDPAPAEAPAEVQRGVRLREASGAAQKTCLPCRLTFYPGETKEPAATHHLEDRGAPMAADWQVLTRWPDGSARDASAIVPVELEAGAERVFHLARGASQALKAPTIDSRILARLPAARDGAPWFDLVSEVEDHDGTIHRARLRLDSTWTSPHRGGAIQSFRFRDYHKGIASKLDRDFLTLSGWIELRGGDRELTLDLQLGNDYLGAPKRVGELDAESFPLGGAVRFRRWTLRVRHWHVAVHHAQELGVGAARNDLGWSSFDLLKQPPLKSDGTEDFHALGDGQTLIRRLSLTPADPNQAYGESQMSLRDLVRHAAQPLIARPLLPGLRATGSYALLGELGPSSLPMMELARRRAEARKAIYSDPQRTGPFGTFATQIRSFDPQAGSYAPLLTWLQGIDADWNLCELTAYQYVALRPVHLFGVRAHRQTQWRGDLSLGRPVNLAALRPWIASSVPSMAIFGGRDPASYAPSDELSELYLATLRPYFFDQLHFHQQRILAASQIPFTTSTRGEAELLRTAVLSERILPDPRLRRAFVERWQKLVLPNMAALSDQGAGPFYVVAQVPRVQAWGPDIYWDAPSEAGFFAAAAIAAWRDWKEVAFLDGAFRAGVFLVAAWLPRAEGKGSGFARELPVYRQVKGERVPIDRNWFLSEEPIGWDVNGQLVSTTRRARLRVQIDDWALHCESPLFLLSEMEKEWARLPELPANAIRRLTTQAGEIARTLHDASRRDDPDTGYSIGSDPWRQVGRNRATRDRLNDSVVPAEVTGR